MVKPTCTQSESPTKDGLDTNSSSSKYKGVRKRKWGKWVSEVRLPNSRERIWLGSYDSAEKAARAFDAAQYCLRGHDAKFNFPENPPNIVGGRSLSPPEIQAVASRFAKEVVEAPGTTTPGNNNNDNTTINDSSNNNNVGTTTGPYTPSSSVSVSDGGAATQVDSNHEMMDWSSFLSMLDTNEGMSDYSFYSGLDHLPGDQFYPPPILGPPPIEDNMDDDQNGGADNGFSQSSFLWDF